MKKIFTAVLAAAIVACLMAVPASAITTGKWEYSQGTQDLIDKTLNELPEYQPEEPPVEPEKPALPCWADTIKHIMQHWFDRWDRWDVMLRE